MALIKFRPDMDYPSIPRRFSDMMDEFFNDSMTLGDRSGFVPGIDITEDDNQYNIHVTLPGMKKEDIKIDLEDRTLTISGERKQEKEDKNVKYHIIESRYGQFERSFTLPSNVDLDSLNAKYKDGMLNLTIQKVQKKMSKQIDIK
ncbi:MAG: Hsp20/alpha crystallin family protein [Balneolales bacterium]